MICVCDPSPQSNNHTQSSEDINIYWSFMKDMCSPLAHLWKTCIPQLFAIVPMWKTCVPQLFAIDTFVKDMCSPAVRHWHICERHAFPSCSPLTHLWETCIPQMFAIHTFINKNNKIWGVPYRMGHHFCASMQSFRVESNLCRFGFIACWYIYCC